MRRLTFLLSAAALALLSLVAVPGAASADGPDGHEGELGPTPAITYVVDESTLAFAPVVGFENSNRQWGVLDNAGWRIEIPAHWNGELVMWAHGFRGTDTRLYFNPEEVPFRQWLLEHGYAWAASTYSRNDYNVGTAVTDTRRLADHFSEVADTKPTRTYIAGASMGGHVTAASIERYPRYYDGALPVCGVLGDYELFDFYLDFNLSAQQLGLGTSQFPAAAGYNTVTAPAIKRALEAAPGTWPVALNARGQALKQLTELRSGGDRPNFDEAWLFWNSVPQFGSNIPGNFLFDLGLGTGKVAQSPKVSVDNIGVFYETDLIPGPSTPLEDELNAGIARVAPERGARRNTPGSASPQLFGRIKVPVLTMHNLGDLFVPFSMETQYGADVAAAGRSHLLVQRAIRGVGHCDFSRAEYEAAMGDLVNWVETGHRPAGDPVSEPVAVAAPDFGCAFTDPRPGAHLLATACP
jgi:pimeloyl-ACP methyl ester carboxylesterase